MKISIPAIIKVSKDSTVIYGLVGVVYSEFSSLIVTILFAVWFVVFLLLMYLLENYVRLKNLIFFVKLIILTLPFPFCQSSTMLFNKL